MKISIIIPVYNIEKYVGKCLESIVCQLCEDVEVIVVDDGSFDNSPAICDSYAEKYSQINVIHKQNGGLVSARKAGLEFASGDYIMPVDGDDWLEPDAIDTLISAIEENPADVICYSFNSAIGGEKIKKSFPYNEGYYDKKRLETEVYPNLICTKTGKGFPVSIWCKIFKRELYIKYQNIVPDIVNMGEDALVSQPCVFYANDIYVIDKPLYNYRYNENSITKSRKKGFLWELPEIRSRHIRSVIPMDKYDFKQQADRTFVHSMFNVAKSHFQVQNSKYFQVKKELKKQLDKPFCRDAVKNSNAKFGTKEWFAQFALKNRLTILICLYAKLEYFF